jgi:hypothetical protein
MDPKLRPLPGCGLTLTSCAVLATRKGRNCVSAANVCGCRPSNVMEHSPWLALLQLTLERLVEDGWKNCFQFHLSIELQSL